jgi:MoaA/NifB/PqqE/SkfB family radical SAM enzyme
VIVQWELGGVCRASCLRCRPAIAADADAVALSAIEAPDVVAQIADLGAARLVLSGENLHARPDLGAIVRTAADAGMDVIVWLCAPSVTRATMRRLAVAGAPTVALALDPRASEDETTARARRVATSARSARDCGLTVQIDTTVTGGNVDGFEAVACRMTAIAPALWHVRAGVVRDGDRRLLSPVAYETMLHRVCAWRAETGRAVHTSAAPAIARVSFERACFRPQRGSGRGSRARCGRGPA